MNIKSYISSLIRSKGKHSFIRHLKKCSSILDIGCSDTGAQLINKFRPDINYTGIDICETNSLTTKPKIYEQTNAIKMIKVSCILVKVTFFTGCTILSIGSGVRSKSFFI